MCCVSAKTRRHVWTILWRVFLKLSRNKGNIIQIYNICITGMILSLVMYKAPVMQDGGDNFQYMRTLNSTNWPVEDQGYVPSEEDLQNGTLFRNFSSICRENSQTVIGLVAPTEYQNILESFYQDLEEKYFMPQQKNYFRKMIWTSEQDMESYQTSTGSLYAGQICFAIVLDQWKHVNQDTAGKRVYNFKIRYPTMFYSNMMQSDMTRTDLASAYDFTNGYYLQFNTSVLEVMSGLTERVIVQEQDGQTQKLDYAYQLKFTPTYQKGDKLMDYSNYQIVAMFTGFSFNPLPTLGISTIAAMLESHEPLIWGLTKSMGLQHKSWLLATLIMTTLLMIPAAGILTLAYGIKVFQHSDLSILLVSIIAYTYSSFFQAAFFFVSLGAGGLICFMALNLLSFIGLSIIGYIVLVPSNITFYLGFINPMIPFNNIMRCFILFQFKTENGMHWDNIQFIVQDNNTLHNIYSLIACTVLYLVLTIYLWPLKYTRDGRKMTLCYCLQPSFWKKRGRSNSQTQKFISEQNEILIDSKILLRAEQTLVDEGNLEVPTLTNFIISDNDYLDDALRINNLVREFPNHNQETKKEKPKVRAVDELSLSMFKNQIFVLLGHNGAGKTTTMSMLSGQLTHSGGSAQAFQNDIFTQQDLMNDITGICPQKDILIESLTVMENIKYFCSLRMMTNEQIENYANEVLERLSIMNKKNSIVRTLSGGQKRKLQLLIALAGDIKLVLLDEPSSGMDPTARKDTWDLIKSHSKGKIMILTTHYMDEAEVLGDRIGIMSKGQLKVCGSPLFLKNKYGLGTLLEISMKDKGHDQMAKLENFLESYQKKAFEERSQDQESLRNSQIVQMQDIKGRLDESNLYIIKLPALLKPYFSEIFDQLDRSEVKREMNIDTYNVRVTSLEEVFNALGEEELAQESQDNLGANQLDDSDVQLDSQPMPIKQLSQMQYMSIILGNRIKIMKRKYEFFAFILMPVGLMIMIMGTMIQTEGFKFFSSVPISTPSGIYNSSNIGEYQVGIQKTSFQDNERFSPTSFSDEICPVEGVNCQFIDNTKNENARVMAQSFSSEAFKLSQQTQKPILGMLFLGNQIASTDVSQPSQMELNVFANLSSPISLPVIGGQGLNRIAQLLSQKDDFEIKFDMQLLPHNPIVAMANPPQPPLFAMTITTIIGFIWLLFAREDLFRLVRMRETGILKQYLLMGVPIKAFLLSSALLVSLSILVSTALITGFLQLLLMDFSYIWVTWILSAATIPVYNMYFYVTSTGQSLGSVKGQVNGCFMLQCFVVGSAICFMAYGSIWLPAVIIETLLSYNPYFASGFIWCKYVFSYYFWKIQDPLDPTKGVEWYSFNRSMPELIGLSFGFFFFLITYLRNVNKGMIQAAKVGNDGTIDKLRNARDKFPQISDFDLNAESQELIVDDMVREEQERVRKVIKGELPSETLTVSLLKKFFITKKQKKEESKETDASEMLADNQSKNNIVKAVQGISFGLNKGECFILLGVNGAGKSTTFKCLNSEEIVTQGDIQIDGRSITDYYGAPHLMANVIGYCPQISPVDAELTVKEKLELLAKLQGLDNETAQKYAKLVAKKFEIYQFFNTYADKLSGGNQRKLMTAIAMFTTPKLVMLDEASAGVDPYSRRRLWKTIRNQGEKSALVVTTHSMEEAEALGTKMAIQVGGRFKCFGTAQQIKHKFGQGFTCVFKIDIKKLDQRIDIFANGNIDTRDTMTMISKDDPQLAESSHSQTEQFQLETKDEGFMSVEKVKERIVQWFMSEAGHSDDENQTAQFVADQFQHELTAKGMLSAQYELIQAGKPLNLQQLFKQIKLLSQITLIIGELEAEFGETQLINFTGNQLSVKILDQNNKSIGYLFGFIEKMKHNTEKFFINEYQAQETTLEQIFNQFAKENEFTKLNRSIKRTQTLKKYAPQGAGGAATPLILKN